jgi:hypothetical protein
LFHRCRSHTFRFARGRCKTGVYHPSAIACSSWRRTRWHFVGFCFFRLQLHLSFAQVMALGLLGAVVGNRTFGPELNNFYREYGLMHFSASLSLVWFSLLFLVALCFRCTRDLFCLCATYSWQVRDRHFEHLLRVGQSARGSPIHRHLLVHLHSFILHGQCSV